MKKALSVLLCLCLVLSVFTVVPFAASAAEVTEESVGASSGTTGDCTWMLDDNGVLTISGNGKMGDYGYTYSSGSRVTAAPWEYNMTSVIIEDGVTSIGNDAFFGCKNLTSVTIPDSVTSISIGAFYGCTNLTSVTIPDSVTSISIDAFERCTGLTSVTIGNSVTSIGSSAFERCTGLTSVTIPNSVTNIGSSAFERCTGLTSVTIPNSVTNIGSSAFEYCTGLTSVTIGNGVTSIGDYAFSHCEKRNNVTIGNSVTSIGSSAFRHCTGLTSVTIPNSVTSIGNDAFWHCTGLTSVSIPNSVTSIGSYAFWDCTGLTSVTIGNSVTNIGLRAFGGCTGLTSVTIPNSVTSIGSGAFERCTGLTSVTIPNSVTSIGSGAFDRCTGLTSVTIGNSVTSIGSSAFHSCTRLTSVTIPDSVTSIGGSAFYGTTWYNNQPNGLIYAGKVAYKYKGTMPDNTSITIKDGTKGITDSAFDGCKNLTSVSIPNSVTSIGEDAFFGCTGLRSVTIGNSVTSIGSSAFEYCTGLTSVTIPDSVTSIGKDAFYNCTGLKSVIIPDSVTNIGLRAFGGCTSLKYVYYSGTEDDWNRISIKDGNNYLLNASIHFRDKGGYVANNAHDYSRFYDFSYSDDIWTAPRKDGTVPVEMDLGLYQDEGKLTKMNIKWSYSMFGKSSSIADNDLAIASLVLSANAYVRERQRKTLEDLGFSKSNIEFYNITGYDDINRVENVIASTVQLINGKQTNVIVIACRGTVTLHQDWVSNIVQQAQGFRYAAEDIKNDLVDYIKTRHINTSMPTKVLLTGHSRGGAAANILATIIPSDIAKESDIFTYTFDCPNTTNDAGRENYPIFNILNSGDPVTQVPVIYDACPRFGAYNIWFDKATAKDFNSYFTAVTGLNDVTYVLDYPLAWCNGTFGNQYMYPFRHHSLALYLAFLLGEGIENNRRIIILLISTKKESLSSAL